MSLNCEQCGAVLIEGNAFCTKCGARRGDASEPTPRGRFCTKCGAGHAAMLRRLAAAAIVLSLAQVAPPARAQGSGTTSPIKLSFKPLVGGDYEDATVTLAQPVPPCDPKQPPSKCGLSVQVISSRTITSKSSALPSSCGCRPSATRARA
jgi:hypothetical protein